ncbi:replication factor C large subunit [archaeon]|jgi:replication factor C large subunit|nr:replication factor C large subunit [archaeon]MBT3577667.1 replication factor C large subunit [archaeon]MBT6820066.1 replication factor C large subunit [archaeon]MBT6955771.1 replication factor C large subunit [archaeon]MBT7025332.1 replication factor C large subunit [archaeon]
MISVENVPWCEKYRAGCFADVKGQELAIDKVKTFLKSFPKKKAVVLHGTPGTGKTSLAYAIAFEMDAEILELNASDLRNKAKISEIIGPASQQRSLFKKNKIILIDEVDGVSATKDRGGLGELLGLIEKSAFPIVVTANDIWQRKFNLLRRKTELVQLKEVDYRIVLDVLKGVCEKENCVVSSEVLTSIAIKARGDIRAALNDLQLLSKMESPELVKEVGERNREQSIFTALQFVFKNARIDSEMIRVYDEVNMPIDDIFLWIEENIPLEYKGAELAKAYDALSLADVFRGRIRRQRHWRFMVYEYFLLGAGIAASKKYNRTGWTGYKKPSRILKIWLQNQRAAKKKTICQKYAKHCHISTKTAMKDFMLLKQILVGSEIRTELKLSNDEIAYLDKPLTA